MYSQWIHGAELSLETPLGADFSTTISAIQSVSHGFHDLKTVPLVKRQVWLQTALSRIQNDFFPSHLSFFEKRGAFRELLLAEQKCFLKKVENLLTQNGTALPFGPCLIYGSRSSPLARLWPVLQALQSGCSVVFLVNADLQEMYLALVKILIDSGYPPTSLALLTTNDAESLETLVQHPSLKGIYFRGHNYEGAFLTKTPLPLFQKRLKIHWGGKNPVIFTYDAALDTMESWLQRSFDIHHLAEHRFHRWFVQEKNYASFIEKVQSLLPTITERIAQQAHTDTTYSQALQTQNTSLFKEKNWKTLENGNVSINFDFNNCSPWHQQETLGLNLTITRYKNSAEAFKFSNTTNYASTGCVFAGQVEKAQELGKQLTMPHIFANQIPDLIELIDIRGLVGCGLGFEITDKDFFTFS